MSVVFTVIIAIVVFMLIILIHEFGHYLTARLCGVTVHEFALGMGPQIFSRVSKKSGIRYSIRLFLIGGYVSMDGEDGDSENPNAFCNKNVWQRSVQQQLLSQHLLTIALTTLKVVHTTLVL